MIINSNLSNLNGNQFIIDNTSIPTQSVGFQNLDDSQHVVSLISYQAFKNEFTSCSEFSTDESDLRFIYCQCVKIQKNIIDDGFQKIDAKTSGLSHTLLVTKNKLIIVKKLLGKGGHSSVNECTVIITHDHIFREEQVKAGSLFSLKVRMTTKGYSQYSPAKRLLSQIDPKSDGKYIDKHLETFKSKVDESSVESISLHEKYACALADYKFTNSLFPASFLVKLFIPVAKSMKAIHDQGIIHRDIKPQNILLSDQNEGILSDLDDVISLEKVSTRATFGTVRYLDPYAFGSVESSIINQSKRYGLADRAVDIRALGITLIESVGEQFFAQLMSSEFEKDEDLSGRIKKVCFASRFNEENLTKKRLMELSNKYPYQLLYLEQSQNSSTHAVLSTKFYQSLDPNESIKGLSELTCQFFESGVERDSLLLISYLAYRMIGPRELRFNTDRVVNYLEKIQNILNASRAPVSTSLESSQDSCLNSDRVASEENLRDSIQSDLLSKIAHQQAKQILIEMFKACDNLNLNEGTSSKQHYSKDFNMKGIILKDEVNNSSSSVIDSGAGEESLDPTMLVTPKKRSIWQLNLSSPSSKRRRISQISWEKENLIGNQALDVISDRFRVNLLHESKSLPLFTNGLSAAKLLNFT